MMETELEKAFTWEIDNFSEQISPIKSSPFTNYGCEWHVLLHPKGEDVDDHLTLYLCVTEPKSLKRGWKRRASFGFVILNQSGKVLHTTSEGTNWFHAEVPAWGFRKAVPRELLDIEVVKNNKLIIEVHTKVYEVVHEGEETKNEMIEIGGFQVLASQFISVSQIFTRYPNFAVDVKPESKAVKSAYMNILLGLNQTLHKPQESISKTELDEAERELHDLINVGFELHWLESKLNEVFTEREKSGDSRVQALNESIKNVEGFLINLRRELYHEKFNQRLRDGRKSVIFKEEEDDDDVRCLGSTCTTTRQRSFFNGNNAD